MNSDKILKLARRKDKYGFVDENGKPVIPFVFDRAEKFYGPYTVAQINGYGHFIIDKKGNNVLKKPIFHIRFLLAKERENSDCPYNFYLFDQNQHCCAVLDHNLNVLVPWGRYDIYGNSSEGIFLLKNPMQYFGYAGFGEVIKPCIYNHALSFKNGFAPVENKEHKWGLINHRGDTVIPEIYDDLSDVCEGLVVAKQGNNYGYLDTAGNVAIPFIFCKAAPFENGVAEVESIDGRKLLIDHSCHPIEKKKFIPAGIKGKGETQLSKILKLAKINQKKRMLFKSLEGKVVELKRKLLVEYLTHYCAPYTGCGSEYIPKGTRFLIRQTMNSNSFYCDINNKQIVEQICKKEKEHPKNRLLEGRFRGISFFLTQDQLLKYTKVVSETSTDEFA